MNIIPNHYLAFLVTANGIDLNPVISPIGKVHYSASTFDAIGEMKFSPDGSRLASVSLASPNIELFDFNNATGELSNLIIVNENGGYDSLGNASGLYSCSFSPNGSLLYASKMIAGNTPSSLLQFDVSSGDSATINASKMEIFSSFTRNSYGLKIAPNGKIYRGQNTNYLGVIHFPDSLGLACGYVNDGLYLNVTSDSWGLNNLMELQSYCPPVNIAQETNQGVRLIIYPNPAHNALRMELPYEETFTIEIRDAMGRLLESLDAASRTTTMDCSGLAAGVYFVLAFNEDRILSCRFVHE